MTFSCSPSFVGHSLEYMHRLILTGLPLFGNQTFDSLLKCSSVVQIPFLPCSETRWYSTIFILQNWFWNWSCGNFILKCLSGVQKITSENKPFVLRVVSVNCRRWKIAQFLLANQNERRRDDGTTIRLPGHCVRMGLNVKNQTNLFSALYLERSCK